MTDGKEVVLAVRHDDERNAVSDLLRELNMIVHHADSAQDAIHMLEDYPYDFLVTDIMLNDMHSYKMLGILKESIDLTALPIIVIMDEQTVVPLPNVTAVVRPMAMAKLRNIIFTLFSQT